MQTKDRPAAFAYLQLLEAQTERETAPVKVLSPDSLNGIVERPQRASATRLAIQEAQRALVSVVRGDVEPVDPSQLSRVRRAKIQAIRELNALGSNHRQAMSAAGRYDF